MPQFKTAIDLFGEPVELRASTLMGEKIPISCFLAGGEAIADVAFIRPFDGLIEYDDTRMLAAVEDVRRRRSIGFNLFFLVAKPILFLIDLVLAFLRGMGRFFGSMSIFGLFSVAIGLFALMAIVLTLGAMAIVFVYALPVVVVAYGVKAAYESGSRDAVTRMKTACQSLSGMVARGDDVDEAEAGNGVVIDATSEDVTPTPSASPPVLAAPAVAGSGRLQGQLAKGLMIGLVIGIPGAAIVAFLPALQNQTPTTTQQVPAPVPAPKREEAAVPRPMAPPAPPKPEVRSGPAEVIDTATLTVGGQPVQLAGLVPVQVPEAKAAAQAYLQQVGAVRCEALPAGAWRCLVPSKGLDVAEVFALSGFAKADVDAPEFIRAAEAMARENRRGIWGAS